MNVVVLTFMLEDTKVEPNVLERGQHFKEYFHKFS